MCGNNLNVFNEHFLGHWRLLNDYFVACIFINTIRVLLAKIRIHVTNYFLFWLQHALQIITKTHQSKLCLLPRTNTTMTSYTINSQLYISIRFILYHRPRHSIDFTLCTQPSGVVNEWLNTAFLVFFAICVYMICLPAWKRFITAKYKRNIFTSCEIARKTPK